jgi:hypothetical protein
MVNYETEAGYDVSVFLASKPVFNEEHLSSLMPSDQNDLLYESVTVQLNRKSSILDEKQYLDISYEESSIVKYSTATSVLTIKEVQFKHGGNYTCAPSNTNSTSVNVHVLNGKNDF